MCFLFYTKIRKKIKESKKIPQKVYHFRGILFSILIQFNFQLAANILLL